MELSYKLQNCFVGLSFLFSTFAGADYLFSNENKNDLETKVIVETKSKSKEIKIENYPKINHANMNYKMFPSEDEIPKEIRGLHFIENEYVLGVDKAKQQLIVYKKSEKKWTKEKEYKASTGMNKGNKEKKGDHKTPEGLFFIRSIEKSNHWLYDNEKAYGPWFMRLSGEWHSIGIHGTNEPEKLGENVSHGCVRVASENISEIKDKYAVKGMYVLIDKKFEYKKILLMKFVPTINDKINFQKNRKNLEKRYDMLEKQVFIDNYFQKKQNNFQNYTH